MALTVRHRFHPDEDARAEDLNENFDDVIAGVEGVTGAAAGTDAYQAGVVGSTDWKPGAGSINSSTAALSFTTFGGAAWLPDPVAGLLRTFQESGTVGSLLASPLPATGKYTNVGVELTAAGTGATVSVVSGVEQASEALALANPAAVTAGKMRARDVIVLNTAGVYSIVKERDRRPWALGASGTIVRTAGTLNIATPAVAVLSSSFQQRVECTGRPVELLLHGSCLNGSGSEQVINFGFRMDGTKVDGIEDGSSVRLELGAGGQGLVAVRYVLTPPAGSHLFTPTAFSTGASAKFYAEAEKPGFFTVREQRVSANNGTA